MPKYINQISPFSNGNCQNKYFTEDEFNHLTNKIHPKFSVFHLNIRSLNCNHGELIAYLQVLNNKFDCICLSEIWNYNLEFYNNILPGYTAYFDKVQDSNIGGVAVFVKSSLKVSEREDLKIINSEHEKVKTENLWLEIVKSTGAKFVVSVIYRHPNGNVTNFSEKFEHSLDTLNHDRTITLIKPD